MEGKQYSKIRFIGYAIPTTPAKYVSIGDPNGPGAVAGTYLGDPDCRDDIRNRIEILKNAVDTAKALLPEGDGVINLFTAPEFYFHGPLGPYIYSTPDLDPVDLLKQELAAVFNADDYPGWIFVFGSAVTSMIKDLDNTLNSSSTKIRNKIVRTLSEQWLNAYGPLKGVIFDMLVNFIKVCHSYPCCMVRNRSVIVGNIPIRTPQKDIETQIMTTEKYYVSNEDFVLYEADDKDVITEQMTAYPPIDLSAGDAKQGDFDVYAIFRQNDIDPDNPIKTSVMDYGVEICLDHGDTRLRRNIENEPPVIGGVHVQVIPSCGMQIQHPGVAADRNGFVFNCDGQYALNKKADKGQAKIDEVNCLYANYYYQPDSKQHKPPKETKYAAHTQLARVKTPAQGGDPNADGSTNAKFHTLDPSGIKVKNVDAPSNLAGYFAGGAGQIHIYGLKTPYTLYP